MGDFFISVSELAALLDSEKPPLLFNVRKPEAYADSGWVIPCARWRDPACVAQWANEIPFASQVVVYCVHGHEVSQGVGAALRDCGFDARVLEGGFAGWTEAGGVAVPAGDLDGGTAQ